MPSQRDLRARNTEARAVEEREREDDEESGERRRDPTTAATARLSPSRSPARPRRRSDAGSHTQGDSLKAIPDAVAERRTVLPSKAGPSPRSRTRCAVAATVLIHRLSSLCAICVSLCLALAVPILCFRNLNCNSSPDPTFYLK